jgi:hypothetical protein
VVLLNTGVQVDEHEEYEPRSDHRVRRLTTLDTAADNLALQTEILGRAAAFVGTYGGLSYLAPALGTPTMSFWSDSSAVKPEHVRMGALASEALDTALDVGDIDVLPLIDSASS